MASGNTIKAIPLSFFDASLLSTIVKQAINPGGLPNACNKIRIINASNTNVFISYDDNFENDLVRANSDMELNSQELALPPSDVSLIPKNTTIYVSGIAGVGNIYLAGYYQ